MRELAYSDQFLSAPREYAMARSIAFLRVPCQSQRGNESSEPYALSMEQAWQKQVIMIACRVQQLDWFPLLPPLPSHLKLLSILHNWNITILLSAFNTIPVRRTHHSTLSCTMERQGSTATWLCKVRCIPSQTLCSYKPLSKVKSQQANASGGLSAGCTSLHSARSALCKGYLLWQPICTAATLAGCGQSLQCAATRRIASYLPASLALCMTWMGTRSILLRMRISTSPPQNWGDSSRLQYLESIAPAVSRCRPRLTSPSSSSFDLHGHNPPI